MRLTLEPASASQPATGNGMARVKIYQSLTDLPAQYGQLFAENAKESFFHSLPWFQNFCSAALDPGDQLRIFAAELGDPAQTPAAALVLRYQPSATRGLGARTLSSLTNFYTSLYAPLRSASKDSKGALELLARAVQEDSAEWDAVDLKWLDGDSRVFHELQQAFRSAGMVVQTYFCAGNWFLPVNGKSYQQYLESLRSSVRNIARSKNRKIERSGRARVEIATKLEGLEPFVKAYEQIYASSWKVPEPYPQFILGLIRTCANQGWLRLGVAYVDGQPAAAQIWIVANGTASIYKIAYAKRFADLSIGSFLTMRMMEYALDVDHVREVDYLTGDDKYKQDWMSHRRERWGILALNPRTFRGALAVARHVGGRAAKRALMSVTENLRRAVHDQEKHRSRDGAK